VKDKRQRREGETEKRWRDRRERKRERERDIYLYIYIQNINTYIVKAIAQLVRFSFGPPPATATLYFMSYEMDITI
jgi:hypothetical protein